MAIWRVILMLLVLLGLQSHAAEAADVEQRRFALVIGNANYTNIDRLSNPVRDARELAAALRRQKFEVDLVSDATRAELKSAIGDYQRKVAAAGNAVALVFYSGHGLQIDGQNSLLMIDADLGTGNLSASSYPVTELMFDATRGRRGTIFIFDACRNLSGLSNGRLAAGFAESSQKESPPGSLIAYSTAAGAIALDGAPSGGSPYLKALLAELPVPAQRVEVMFTNIAKRVFESTGEAQQPAIHGLWDREVVLAAAAATADERLTAEAEEKRYGVGQPQDLKGGYRLALRAARNGHAPAMRIVASALYYGDGVRKDQPAGIRWFERAAGLGDVDSLINLASIAPASPLAARGLTMIRKMAGEGDANAAYSLALINQNGVGVPVDKREALRLYKIAADQGHPAAMINHGRMHHIGDGIPVDRAIAKQMYEKAAAAGAQRAMSLLGVLLTTVGTGVRDPGRERDAFDWLTKAFRSDAQAGQYLGWHHYFGIGTPRNRQEAIRIWESARKRPFIDSGVRDLDVILSHIRKGGEWRECGTAGRTAFCRN